MALLKLPKIKIGGDLGKLGRAGLGIGLNSALGPLGGLLGGYAVQQLGLDRRLGLRPGAPGGMRDLPGSSAIVGDAERLFRADTDAIRTSMARRGIGGPASRAALGAAQGSYLANVNRGLADLQLRRQQEEAARKRARQEEMLNLLMTGASLYGQYGGKVPRLRLPSKRKSPPSYPMT